MEKDNRQKALMQLLKVETAKGYVTFDDIMQCADDNSLSIGELDWLSEAASSRNVIIYEETPFSVRSEDEEYDDYAQIDYEQTFIEAIEMCPELEALINDIRSIIPPQRGEVGRLKYALKEGNSHARDRMIEMYLRLALRIAVSRAKAYDLDLSETVGDAFRGLIIAVDKYDSDTSGPFTSFASLWIYQYITRLQSTKNPHIYFPYHRKEWFYTMYPLFKEQGCLACEDFTQCENAIEMICNRIYCNKEEARDVVIASKDYLSIESIFENVDSLLYKELISRWTIDSNLQELTEQVLLKKQLNEVLDTLPQREKEVIILRYGIGDEIERTLEKVGQIIGVSRERVRQIEKSALTKLRQPSRNRKLRDYLD